MIWHQPSSGSRLEAAVHGFERKGTDSKGNLLYVSACGAIVIHRREPLSGSEFPHGRVCPACMMRRQRRAMVVSARRTK